MMVIWLHRFETWLAKLGMMALVTTSKTRRVRSSRMLLAFDVVLLRQFGSGLLDEASASSYVGMRSVEGEGSRSDLDIF
jgi:hypothetical protein